MELNAAVGVADHLHRKEGTRNVYQHCHSLPHVDGSLAIEADGVTNMAF